MFQEHLPVRLIESWDNSTGTIQCPHRRVIVNCIDREETCLWDLLRSDDDETGPRRRRLVPVEHQSMRRQRVQDQE